jgi:cation diffusion facilitator CzcD-associated flavoprotein CzcO
MFLKGCSSDVPMALYSLSTDLRNWKETHGSQKDIYEYWVSLANKYGLYDHIVLNSNAISAKWDDMAQEYEIVTENTITGEQSRSTAHILISAIGVLETPRLPSIPGLESFKGEMFHSARWNPEVELGGKRVGVVGNAASA